MLMRCENCGKMFDYETAGGVCPGCGEFCRLPEGAAAFRAGAPEPFAAAEYDRPGAAARRAPNGWCAAFFALVLLWLCVMGGGYALLRHQQSLLPARAAFASPVADEVNGAFRRQGREITVVTAEIMGDGYRIGLPEDGCLVRVRLRFDKTSLYNCSDLLYLQSDGCFYQAAGNYALSSYRLGQLYPELTRDALDESVLQFPDAGQGWLYFVLPGPPEDAALYLEQAEGYGSERRVTGAAFCPLTFAQTESRTGTEGGDADG